MAGGESHAVTKLGGYCAHPVDAGLREQDGVALTWEARRGLRLLLFAFSSASHGGVGSLTPSDSLFLYVVQGFQLDDRAVKHYCSGD